MSQHEFSGAFEYKSIFVENGKSLHFHFISALLQMNNGTLCWVENWAPLGIVFVYMLFVWRIVCEDGPYKLHIIVGENIFWENEIMLLKRWGGKVWNYFPIFLIYCWVRILNLLYSYRMYVGQLIWIRMRCMGKSEELSWYPW